MEKEIIDKIIKCFESIELYFIDYFDEYHIDAYVGESGKFERVHNPGRGFSPEYTDIVNRVDCMGIEDNFNDVISLILYPNYAKIKYVQINNLDPEDVIKHELRKLGLEDIVIIEENPKCEVFIETYKTQKGYCGFCKLIPGWVVVSTGDIDEFDFDNFEEDVKKSIDFYVNCAKENLFDYPSIFSEDYEIVYIFEKNKAIEK